MNSPDSPTELVEDTMTVPEDVIARIIGKVGTLTKRSIDTFVTCVRKGGVRLRELEDQYSVGIDVDKRLLTIQITGATRGVLDARDRIAVIIDTVVEEVDLTEAQVVTLLQSRAARINEISSQFSVRIDASVANRKVKITGLTAAVAAAKLAVISVDATSDTIVVNVRVHGALGGSPAEIHFQCGCRGH